ncbi:MAG: hypothetical protein LBL07_00435 [Tannerella sp.]|jgi:hypothetical protein|nr:hypothetical protein [Tannerella sp.]
MSNYIKVTKKDGTQAIVTSYCRSFYEKEGCKIEAPTQKEIDVFEGRSNTNETKQALADAGAELEKANAALATEKAAHAETKQALADANAELENVKTALNEAQKQITKLSKKE